MYLPLAGFPVRHLGSNDPVPQKVQSGVRSRQCICSDKCNNGEKFRSFMSIENIHKKDVGHTRAPAIKASSVTL